MIIDRDIRVEPAKNWRTNFEICPPNFSIFLPKYFLGPKLKGGGEGQGEKESAVADSSSRLYVLLGPFYTCCVLLLDDVMSQKVFEYTFIRGPRHGQDIM